LERCLPVCQFQTVSTEGFTPLDCVPIFVPTLRQNRA
jgi:hypothetical protein